MFPPPAPHKRALPAESLQKSSLAAHLVVRGVSAPNRDLDPNETVTRPYNPHLSVARLGKTLFKGHGRAASALRRDVISDAAGGARATREGRPPPPPPFPAPFPPPPPSPAPFPPPPRPRTPGRFRWKL